MRLNELLLLMRKDVTLMWRDKSIFLVVLLVCLPLVQTLRPMLMPRISSQSTSAPVISSGSSVVAPRVTPSESEAEYDSRRRELPAITVGIIGPVPDDLADDKLRVVPTTRAAGLSAFRQGKLDVLAEFPDQFSASVASDSLAVSAPPNTVRVTLFYPTANWSAASPACEYFQHRLHTLELRNRQYLVRTARAANADWLLCSVQYHTLNRFLDTRLSPLSALSEAASDSASPSPSTSEVPASGGSSPTSAAPALPVSAGHPAPPPPLTALSSPLVLAGALIAALVMLVIVEENARHTLPLVLVCAVDRRTVFLSKLALCMVPAVAIVLSMLFRFHLILSRYHLSFLHQLALLATAGGGALLFVFTFCCILVAAGGRSRNSVEALAKVGAPTLLCTFLVGLAYSPLSTSTPGLLLFPLTNTVYLLQQLISTHPAIVPCTLALASSLLFSILLARTGALAMRTEQGLPGEIPITDPKLDSLLLFLLTASTLALLTNLISLPASIVYPSLSQIPFILILATTSLLVLRLRRLPLRTLVSSNGAPLSKPNGVLLASLASVPLAFLTSLACHHLAPTVLPLPVAIPPLPSALASAVTEELTLRGLLTSILAPHFPATVVIALLCPVSAALHPLATTWLPAVVLSATLTCLRLWSRSVIPCVVLHCAHIALLQLLWHHSTP